MRGNVRAGPLTLTLSPEGRGDRPSAFLTLYTVNTLPDAA